MEHLTAGGPVPGRQQRLDQRLLDEASSMTSARQAAGLLFASIWSWGVYARSANGPPALSARGRSPSVAPSKVDATAGRKRAAGPDRAPAVVVAKAPTGFTDKDFNACRKLPAGKPLVKLTLKPETTVDDLVVWISSITCRQFVWSEAVATRNKKVTIVAPLPMTARQAFRLFLDALDSIGLTVEPSGTFWRIIETHKVRSTPVPLYGFDGRRLPG